MPPKPRTKSVTKSNQKSPENSRRVSSRISERVSAVEPDDDTPSATPNKKKPASNTPSRPSSKRAKGPISIITEQDILTTTDSEDLIELINDLTNTKQDEIFTKYQTKMQSQLENDHMLIQELQLELRRKNDTIDKLLDEISQLKQSQSGEAELTFESPIRKRQPMNDITLTKELENISITLDMIELLAGVRVVNFQEDDSMLYFDVKQSSPPLFITYQLIISKEFEATAQVNYVPTFLDALENEFDHGDDEVDIVENARFLKRILPDYLCEKLLFPIDTLAQFYSKVGRALHKKK
ncbi:uncharacterized protein SPAPADRAFT_133618 [Spathaspora passalidarum NRRL Y-27907]|uniref:Monopolin complex subunit Csm1/Pcs1 C-terminal domain-containing protein n=1 Tax=Spathaspora passalidarum (strain NRRL Y-27907 / 11-Y1) TaxID=619300 RepID=G3AI88_SPAPN|nr:uncharacterized protein SPAPADRAFT_133618 [Spathaspora passalidarum NRRL Y-27907]EGW33657.1 hypothetical protein SPAPADRAFT_133618 [Spathaspora passalidarum NRRL Y-27907]